MLGMQFLALRESFRMFLVSKFFSRKLTRAEVFRKNRCLMRTRVFQLIPAQYQTEPCRCAIIVEYVLKNLKLGCFLPRNIGDVAHILEEEHFEQNWNQPKKTSNLRTFFTTVWCSVVFPWNDNNRSQTSEKLQ